MEETRSNDFLVNEKVSVLMRKFAIPCVISLVVAALYNIVDQIFIANATYLGSYGNAANTVVFPMTVVALAIAVMIGDGACAFVSISLGSKKTQDASRSVGNAVVLCLIASVILTAIYLIFQEPILTAFGGRVNDRTFENAKEYFFWISVGIPFYMFGQCLNPIIRSDGSPKFAMISTVSGAVFNIIFDPILIYVVKWGMMGAAIATIGGQILTAILAIWYMTRMKAVKLTGDSFHLDLTVCKRMLPLGITSFLSQASLVVSMAAVQNMCAKYGALDAVFGQTEYAQIPMAVLGIVMKFFQVAISISVGMAAGCIPVVGYNIGAGRKDRAKELFIKLLTAEAILGLVALLIVEVFPGVLINLFGAANESDYYRTFAIYCFRTYLCMMVLATVNKGTFIYLQALGKALESTVISLFREIVLGVALPILLPLAFGLNGVIYAFPMADILTFLLAAYIILRTMKELSASSQATAVLPETHAVSILPSHEGMIITIAREHGTAGKQIGKKLACELGIPFYYKETAALAAEESGLSKEFISSLNRKGPDITKELYLSKDIVQQAVAAQSAIINKIADQGACVIVGRAADYVLRDRKNLYRIFLYAPEAYEVDKNVEMYGDDPETARQNVRSTNHSRAAYYHSISGQNWGDPHNYDLCLDCSVGVEASVKAIINCLEGK